MQSPIEPKADQKPESPRLSEQLQKMFRAVIRRPFLKLSALLLAVAFWAIVIASDPNLMIEKTIQGATVTVQGLDILRGRGYIVMDDLTSKPITVKMRVSVKQSDFSRATAENFSPQLILTQQITGAGENQRVYFTAPSTSLGTVISFEPEYIEVDVEPYASYRVPVVVERAGDATESLWIKSATPDIANVTVRGPKSLVDQISRAVVTLPLDNLSADRPQDRINALLQLRDAADQPISSSLLRVTNDSVNVDSVRIAVEVYPMREIPVDVDGAVIGLPEHGYALGEVRVSPQTVFIAASQAVLDAMDSLHVQTPLNIAGANVDKVTTSPLRDISGTAFFSAHEVVIEADISPAPHVHTFVNIPVTVMGLAPDLTARLSKEEMSVVIRGNYQSLETLTASQVHLSVNAAGLEEGVYTVTVECLVDGCDSFLFTPEMPRLTLMLSKVKPEP